MSVKETQSYFFFIYFGCKNGVVMASASRG